MIQISRTLPIVICAATLALVPACMQTRQGSENNISATELTTLLVGNTIKGAYAYQGTKVQFAEYYSEDGTIAGRDEYRHYEGTYTIVEPNCFKTDYVSESSDEDGCNSYTHLGSNKYLVTSPKGVKTEVTVLEGNQVPDSL